MERDLFRLEGRRMKGKEASRKKGGKELLGAAFGLFVRFWQHRERRGIFEYKRRRSDLISDKNIV
jgi:hypothetical protein